MSRDTHIVRLAVIFATLTFVLGFVVSDIYHKYAATAEASVGWGNEYNASHINTATASSSLIVYKTGYGSVGSVTIASSSAAITAIPLFTIYDATSTMSTSTARKIAEFRGTPTMGTYTFDAVVRYGVAVEVPIGFNGGYTLTWR